MVSAPAAALVVILIASVEGFSPAHVPTHGQEKRNSMVRSGRNHHLQSDRAIAVTAEGVSELSETDEDHERTRVVRSSRTQMLDRYMKECQKNSSEFRIEKWRGRLGNNLWQIHSAIVTALKTGRMHLRFPEEENDDLSSLFDFPKDGLALDPEKASVGRKCDFVSLGTGWDDCNWNSDMSCASTVGERRALYQTYMRPYLKVWNACKPDGDKVLTIHLRSGDVIAGNYPCHLQPKCDYYDKILNEGNNGHPFKTARIVMSEELPVNPCFEHIMSKHKDKRILYDNGTSIAVDFCTLMRAKNLAVTPSSFSTSAKLLNVELDRLFYPAMSHNRGCNGREFRHHMMNFDFEDSGQMCWAFRMAIRFDNPKLGLAYCANNQ